MRALSSSGKSSVPALLCGKAPLPNAKHEALVTLVRELVRARGCPRLETIQQFLAVGYRREQVMELLIGIALNTISNYLARIWPMPVGDGMTSGGS